MGTKTKTIFAMRPGDDELFVLASECGIHQLILMNELPAVVFSDNTVYVSVKDAAEWHEREMAKNGTTGQPDNIHHKAARALREALRKQAEGRIKEE